MIFHCRTGSRTAAAADRLATLADADAYILSGGLQAWKAAGLQTVTDRSHPIELMRQVQIATGSLVLLGVGLGALIHPGFSALSGFVGAGLFLAGVIGTSGMARQLTLAPWNRARPAASPNRNAPLL